MKNLVATKLFTFAFGLFLGLHGWLALGFGEFRLYIPALAWPAFI